MSEKDEKKMSRQLRYYHRNREEISEKNRFRYRTDPEWRERRRVNAAKRAQQIKEELATMTPEERIEYRLRKKGKRGRTKRDPMAPKLFDVQYKGAIIQVEMYTAGQLAFALETSRQTLSNWEDKGWLPPALYKAGGGIRLYTKLQVLSLVAAMGEAYRVLKKNKAVRLLHKTNFFEDAKAIWRRYPQGIETE